MKDGGLLRELNHNEEYDIGIRITTDAATPLQPKIYDDKIIWVDCRYHDNMDLCLLDLSMGTVTLITNDSVADLMPQIWEDIILWVRYEDSYAKIYKYDIKTKEVSCLTNQSTENFSPDIFKDRIVWTSIERINDSLYGHIENADVFFYNLTTNNLIQITFHEFWQGNAEIYADKIVWEDWRNDLDGRYGHKEDNADIYLFDLSNQEEIPVCINKREQRKPVIYGSRIVWEDYRNGNGDIYMYDLGTMSEIPICIHPGQQKEPDIFEDKIVWEDYRNGERDIYMFNLTNRMEYRISTNSKTQAQPSIYGNKIVCCDGRNTEIIDSESVSRLDLYLYDLVRDFDSDGIPDYLDHDDDDDDHPDTEDAYPLDPNKWEKNGVGKSKEEKMFFIPSFEPTILISIIALTAIALNIKREMR
jgi:beta propeller repeat protein